MSSPAELEDMAQALAVTVAPALVTAVHTADPRMIERLLAGLDRQRLLALAVVLAAALDEPDEPRPARQTAVEAKREDYVFLRSAGLTVEEAAERVRITVNNAVKHYERLLPPALAG